MSTGTHNENHQVYHTIVHESTNVLKLCGFDFMTSVMYMLITKYIDKSISELQIQVVTYVFELSVGNCHRQMAALSSFIVTRNDRYVQDCKDGAAVTRWRRPCIRVPRQNSVPLCGFCGQKIWQQRISTKKCCPCTVNIAWHVKQSSKTTSFGGTLS